MDKERLNRPLNQQPDLYEGLTSEEAEAQREWERYIDEMVMPKVRKISIEFQLRKQKSRT